MIYSKTKNSTSLLHSYQLPIAFDVRLCCRLRVCGGVRRQLIECVILDCRLWSNKPRDGGGHVRKANSHGSFDRRITLWRMPLTVLHRRRRRRFDGCLQVCSVASYSCSVASFRVVEKDFHRFVVRDFFRCGRFRSCDIFFFLVFSWVLFVFRGMVLR